MIGRLIATLTYAVVLAGIASFASHGNMKMAGLLAMFAGLWKVHLLYAAAVWKEMYFEARREADSYADEEGTEGCLFDACGPERERDFFNPGPLGEKKEEENGSN